ncbi:MAG TPA: cytochrome c [Gammaproteobacteria bacterium]|nr:cytochrome c [Gammaproteobacteria bacterium]
MLVTRKSGAASCANDGDRAYSTSTWWGAGLTCAALLLCANARAQSAPDGAQIFRSACAACHGADGRGRTSAEVGFEEPLPDFTDCDFSSREQAGDWSAIVQRGGPVRAFSRRMPAFGEALTDEQIDAVVTYVRAFCKDDRWPRGELNMPRALYTEKAYPEDEAVITTTIAAEGPASLTHQFQWEQRFGQLNQMELSLPFSRADLGDPQGHVSGTGDLAIAVKHTLAHDLERGSILAVGGELSLPTGDEAKGFGSGTTVLESFVLYDKLLGQDSFMQLQGTAEFPSSSALEDEVGLRVAFGHTWTTGGGFGRAWTPMIEALAARELESGANTEWDLVPQFQVTLSTRQHVVLGVGAKLPVTEREGRYRELAFYLLWDWFDGGVLQGW